MRYVVERVAFDDPDKEPLHARVATLDVRGPDGGRRRLTALEVLKAMRGGDAFVVEGPRGPAPVARCECTGFPHLRVRDAAAALEALPRCG